MYVDENRVALYDHAKELLQKWMLKKKEKQSQGYTIKAGCVLVRKIPGGQREFIFIRGANDKVAYYNHALHKTVESTLPKSITDSVSWEKPPDKINDNTFALNSGVSGFHLLNLNRKNRAITSDGKKYLRNYKIICLMNDKDGRIWAGTTEGLLKQDLEPPVISAFHYPSPQGIKLAGL